MKILFLAENLDLPELHMLIGMQQQGIEVHAGLSPERTNWDDLRTAGVQVFQLPFRSRCDLRTIHLLRQRFDAERYDLFHALRSNRPVANALLAARGRTIGRICYRGTMGNLSWWDPGSRLTYLSRQLDRVVCVSHAVRNDLLSLGLPEERVVTIHKGHDPAWYQAADQVNRREFGVPDEAFVVGCAANMRPLKGVDVLVRSLDHLPPSVHLLLIGELRDPALATLIEQSPRRSHIHLTGYRTDAQALIGQCQVTTMMSLRREGLPRAVIESMSQSVPAIVSRVGGMPELVEDGVSGYVIDPGDSVALAARISELVENDTRRAQMGAAARHRIETEFSVATTIRKTVAMYEQVLAGRSTTTTS